MFKKFYLSLGALLVVLLLAASVGAACNSVGRFGSSRASSTAVPEDLKAVWETWKLLQQDYVDKKALDPGKLSQGAIKGMLEALDDPYTAYLDQQHVKLESDSFNGSFEGIGAQVTMVDGKITIVAPMPGTPAEKAGIRPGDVILKVDGKNISGLTLQEAILQIRGPKGTPVELVVQRPDEDQPKTFSITRGVIPLKSVGSAMLEGGVAYVAIFAFSENTPNEVEDALKRIQDAGAQGIVLDLRDNPGGLLSATVDIASQFLKDGLVVYEVNSRGQRTDWPVKKGRPVSDLPMVVLVNQFSASGSEVLAGALQDFDRAKLVGIKTFGKGSVNVLKQLSDGSGLYLTYARWYTPNGRPIEGVGLQPDVEIGLPQNAQEDVQLEKALETLRTLMPATVR